MVSAAGLVLAAGLIATVTMVAASSPDGSPSSTFEPSPAAGASADPSPMSSADADASGDPDGVIGALEPPLTVTVEAGDIWFAPTELAIAADASTSLVLVSKGTVPHNLIVDELGLQLHVGPGFSSEVTVSDLPPGEYQFYCGVFGHRRAGMYGTLTVQ